MGVYFHLIIEPAASGRFEHRLAAGAYILGRSEEADLAIRSPEVSRSHARLILEDPLCRIEDLGSTSGTTLDGRMVDGEQTLSPPFTLKLGTVQLSVALADSSEATSSPAAGHYTPGREIAKGGMGSVLEANDQILGRAVAMKVIRPDIAESESLRLRFIREAGVLARLEHPNIVPIHEMAKDAEGNLFYTMKKVEGRDLEQILKAIRDGDAQTIADYPLDRLLTIYRKVCDAMAFAHARGVIHRDLKPANIMVGSFGEVLVMDWGLAKILKDEAQNAAEIAQARSRAPATQLPDGFEEIADSALHGAARNLTLEGSVMGSPQYMPPEQAEGKVSELDERSDIFSLGGILYAVLTLRPPVAGRTVNEILDNVKTGNITPPTSFNAGGTTAKGKAMPQGEVADPSQAVQLPHCPGGRIPGSLSAVAMKALAMAAGDRHASVPELIADIEAFQRGFATSAEEVGAVGQLALFIKRHKGISIAAGIGLLLIVSLSAGFMINVNAEKQAALASDKAARAEADNARKAEELAQTESARALAALAKAQMGLAEQEYQRGNVYEADRLLESIQPDYRDSNWQFLRNNLFQKQIRYTGLQNINFKGDVGLFKGRYFAGRISKLEIVDLDGAKTAWRMPEEITHFDIDPLGEQVACLTKEQEIIIRDLQTRYCQILWMRAGERRAHPDGLVSLRDLLLS